MNTPLRLLPGPTATQGSLALGDGEEIPRRFSGESLTSGQARVFAGTVAEEIVCRGLGLSLLKPDARYGVCFDAVRGGTFYEIKSVRAGNKSPLYDYRMEKEAGAGVPLVYLFARHDGRRFTSRERIHSELSGTMRDVYALPAALVHALAGEYPLRNIRTEVGPDGKDRCGYNRKGYAEGYRNLPTVRVEAEATEPVWDFSGSLRGYRFSFRLWKTPGARILF